MENLKNSSRVKLFSLVFLIISSILSIGNWHIAAQLGIHSIFYLILASLFFMVPVAFISCELASTSQTGGGIFGWIKDAFGMKTALLSTWLMWISNIVWYPTVFTFMAKSLLYYFEPLSSENPFYVVLLMNLLFWCGNYANIIGYKFSSNSISISVILSLVFPAALLIGFAFLSFYRGHDCFELVTNDRLIDYFPTNKEGFVLLTGLLLGFTGMEMATMHYDHTVEAKKSFPRAIWLSALLLIIVSILGTLGISQVIPKQNLNLITDSLDAIFYYLRLFHLDGWMPLINLLITIGSWISMSAYLAEPSKAFYQAVKSSQLSRGLAKSNQHAIPTGIMFLQGIFVTLISIPLAFMKNLTEFYWLLTDIASQLYLLIYIIMFFAAIKLKVINKTFSVHIIPFKEKGVLFFSSVGLLLSSFSFVFGCLPPKGSEHSYPIIYSSFVVVFIFLTAFIPLFILKYKRFKKRLVRG
jgi:amino acid transporter